MADTQRRDRWLTFLILPALVVGVLVLTGVTFRSSFQLEKLREQSVVEATLLLVGEKADRLDKRIVEQDSALMSTLDVADRRRTSEEWLKAAAIQTPTVRALLVVDLAAPGRDVVTFASRGTSGREDEAFRRLLIGPMFSDLRLDQQPVTELKHLHKSYGAESYLVSYWQRQAESHRYLVVAWHDVGRIVHDLFPTLADRSDAPQSRVNVVDEEGRIVFGPPLSRGGLTIGRQFATTLYKWTLNVSMTSSEELSRAVQRRRVLEMTMVGLSSTVVLAGMVVVLVALARERKLANLKADFVANVSHELKTPLSLVRMFGELLQSRRVESDEKRQQYLSIIVTESERLAALIENVLDFAKVERGRQSYDFVDGDVGDVVSRAVEACRLRAERERKALELAIAPELPVVRLDERAIEIAVINLVDNAIKYAPDGDKVAISVIRREGGVEVRVTDEGPGIAAEDKKRIFERFERGKAALGRQIRGSGIGLALVKHIAEAHGGRAWVEPGPERGSTFVFSLRDARKRRPTAD